MTLQARELKPLRERFNPKPCRNTQNNRKTNAFKTVIADKRGRTLTVKSPFYHIKTRKFTKMLLYGNRARPMPLLPPTLQKTPEGTPKNTPILTCGSARISFLTAAADSALAFLEVEQQTDANNCS
jgi:hypothetical protein